MLYGRLEAVSIAKRSETSPKLTRQSLAVMIQHNFVQFSTSLAGGTERTLYECNWKEILGLLRTGKIMWWASQEASPEAAALVKYVSIYGKVKTSDLAAAFTSSHADELTQTIGFDKTLLNLVQSKILRVTTLHESQPVEDFKQSIRDEEMNSMSREAMPETKRAKTVEERLQKRLAQLESVANSQDIGLKRKADLADVGRARKRVRMDDQAQSVVDPDVVLRINHDKYHVHQRNEELVKLCQGRLGPTPAAVYRCVLKEIEPLVFSCRQNTSSIIITTLAISRALPPDLDLASIWATDTSSRRRAEDSHNENSRRKKSKSRTNGSERDSDSAESAKSESEGLFNSDDEGSADDSFIEYDMDELAADEDYDPDREPATPQSGEKIKLVNRFLELFATDSLKFLRKTGSRSMGEWHVDYDALAGTLRQLEIEALVQQKLGDLAPRLLRIVQDKIKVDEKQLSTTALLKQKDIRNILTALHEMGVLELQEVPKRLDRQPSMTFFLWFHNRERAVSALAQDLCRTMCRVHQRLRFELERRRRLLDKSMRTDVRNRESEYLSRGELAELRKIRGVEEKLLAQSSRLADSYAILVDY